MTKSKFRPKETARKSGRRNKKEKLSLVFDPEARKEFLGGFRKRKLQKKATFKLRLDKKVAQEKMRIRAEAKKSVKNLSASHSVLPEVEALLADQLANFNKEDTFDVGSKTVTISSMDTLHPAVPEEDSEDDEGEDAEDSDGKPETPALKGKMKTLLKQSTNRLLQNSIVYKKAQRLKQSKNKRHVRHNPHYKGNIAKGKDAKADAKASAEASKFRGKAPRAKGRRSRGKK
jgi:ribosomal RNA-processing protein 17